MRLRRALGTLVHEVPVFLWGLRPVRESPAPWLWIRNRRETLEAQPGAPGVRCGWRWTSELQAPRAFPHLGLLLLRRALDEWPIALAGTREAASCPDVSIVIGHRGRARSRHLLLTLSSLAAQRGVSLECVVVEQSLEPEIRDDLPSWIRYVHTPVPSPSMPYARSWAFNVGARLAQAPVLVFHDNDMLVPTDYARELLALARAGAEVANLKRFIFYLSEHHTERIQTSSHLSLDDPPERVVQNLEAGGSLAMTREAFEDIGGFDESFVGWGGEDNEIWERAQTRRVHSGGYLPIVHLWHAAQPGKMQAETPGLDRYQELSLRSVASRIAELRSRPRGLLEGPFPPFLDASSPTASS